MIDEHREPRGGHPDDWVHTRWGADRREADANIMTQLMHNELRLTELRFAIFLVGVAGLAYAEGYKGAAVGVMGVLFIMLVMTERQVRDRQARVSKLMDRHLDRIH